MTECLTEKQLAEIREAFNQFDIGKLFFTLIIFITDQHLSSFKICVYLPVFHTSNGWRRNDLGFLII